MELAGTLLTALFRRRRGELQADDHRLAASAANFPMSDRPERKLQHGDIIRMEIFGQKSGYLTGVCRTAVVGDADAGTV